MKPDVLSLLHFSEQARRAGKEKEKKEPKRVTIRGNPFSNGNIYVMDSKGEMHYVNEK